MKILRMAKKKQTKKMRQGLYPRNKKGDKDTIIKKVHQSHRNRLTHENLLTKTKLISLK